MQQAPVPQDRLLKSPVVRTVAATVWTVFLIFLLQPCAERLWSGPDLEIEGVLPILVREQTDGPEAVTFNHDELAIIVKIANRGTSAALVDLALLEGCASLSPSLMQMIKADPGDLQSVRISAGIHDHPESRVVVGPGVGYVGLRFAIPEGGASHLNPDTIGDAEQCWGGQLKSSRASVFQLFGEYRLHYDLPKGLHADFREGSLKLSIYVSNSLIEILPDQILRLAWLRRNSWTELDLAQMYENPDVAYPPKTAHLD